MSAMDAEQVENLCRAIDIQLTYARWVGLRLVDDIGKDNGDGICLLSDMLTKAERLAEDLEAVERGYRELQSKLVLAEGRAAMAEEKLKAAARKVRK